MIKLCYLTNLGEIEGTNSLLIKLINWTNQITKFFRIQIILFWTINHYLEFQVFRF